MRISFELREATAAHPLDETRRSRDEFREWPGIDRWVGCGCARAPGNNIPLPAVAGNMVTVTAANSDEEEGGGATIGAAGTERGTDAGTWDEALTSVVTDDEDSAGDDDKVEDEEDDTDDG